MQTNQIFHWPIRVYYEDTDSGGVVYHANYLNYMERARTEWLRNLGFEQDILLQQYGLIFAVRAIDIDYIKPAQFNNELVVVTTIKKLGKASIVFEQQIKKQNEDIMETLVQAKVKVACVNARVKPMKAVTLPKEMWEIFKRNSD